LSGGDKTNLLSKWQFQIDQEDMGEYECWYNDTFDKSQWMEVEAPRAWDFYDHAMRNYQGVGWYFACISEEQLQNGLWYRLEFAGAGGRTKVWVNGQLAGFNNIRYLPFTVHVDPLLQHDGENTIVVRIDNTPDSQTLPDAHMIEWVLYGGLIQKVEL